MAGDKQGKMRRALNKYSQAKGAKRAQLGDSHSLMRVRMPEWQRYQQHEQVRADVEHHLDDAVDEVVGAFWIVDRHGPVLRKRPAQDEKVRHLDGHKAQHRVSDDYLDVDVLGSVARQSIAVDCESAPIFVPALV